MATSPEESLDQKVCLCFHVSRRKLLNFLRIEKPHGAVEVWALGGDQFSVRAPAWDDTVITGFDVARATAHRLARALE